MFIFSKKSLELLNNDKLDKRLKDLFLEVIKYYDITILETIRTPERQQMLFDTGKSKTLNSKHLKGLAVDCAISPIQWDNKNQFYELAGCIKTIAKQMNIDIKWGGDFKSFFDGPHYELS